MNKSKKKVKKVKRIYSLSVETDNRLNALPRTLLPTKTALIEKLLIQWLDKQDKKMFDNI